MFNTNNIGRGPGNAIMAVAMGTCCLLVASYPVIRMIGWWMEGGAEPLAAMISIFLYVVLVGAAMAMPMGLGLLIFGVILVSAIATPFIGQASDSLQNKRIDDDHLAAYARALEANPMDVVARMALAEALYKRGDREQAIEHMTWALEQFPGLKLRIRPTLDSWLRERERGGKPDLMFCHMCHAENLAGATQCIECGAAFGSKAGVLERVRMEGGPKVIIRGWIVTASVLLVICFALLVLPSIVAGPIIIGALVVGVVLFLRWVGGSMGVAEV